MKQKNCKKYILLRNYFYPAILLSALLFGPAFAAAAPANNRVFFTSTPNEGNTLVAGGDSDTTLIYRFPIREDIMPSTTRLTSHCLEEAEAIGADIIVIDMNTYGGLVDAADSIRTMLLRTKIPVWAYINNQAASAGALIAIAADSIYMRSGGSIGAASVVDQNGNLMPDKYQSFMRAMIRSTAEAHGKKPIINGSDTTWVWHRDPQTAESMVGVYSASGDSLRVTTFTTEEAIVKGFSEGTFESAEEMIATLIEEPYTVTTYEPTLLDKLLGFLTNPALQGIFIMLIIGGIYFEIQSPGIGLAAIVALIGAALYFAPLYLGGLLDYWEVALFLLGIVLIGVEIFVTPGFGVAGVLGIVCMVAGLTFAAIDSDLLRHIPTGEISASHILIPLCTSIVAVVAAILLSIHLGRRFLEGSSPLREKVVLTTEMESGEGFSSHTTSLHQIVGQKGLTTTPLRPTGRVQINGESYAAAGEHGLFVEEGRRVRVTRVETGTVYVAEDPEESPLT